MELNIKDNYYTHIKHVNLFVDYTNQRLKIADSPFISVDLLTSIVAFAKKEGLGKVISNCRINLLKPFNDCGFRIEGKISGFFNGEDAYCVSFFIDPKREVSVHQDEEDSILHNCLIDNKNSSLQREHKYLIRTAAEDDIPQMIQLFATVFTSYPSPVFSKNYLQKVINNKVLFKVAEEDGKIISVASADMDINNINAEITDCATY
ncbi:MAG: putative beta-lysine N-acetyltransferase, partial [Clostridiaceae bacterium]|nr:putative beta-lysine N-acetyltransferase [Clostridiaceae bacterium]